MIDRDVRLIDWGGGLDDLFDQEAIEQPLIRFHTDFGVSEQIRLELRQSLSALQIETADQQGPGFR